MEQERRQCDRYPFPEDNSIVEARILWASTAEFNPFDVEFIDVSRAGLGMISKNAFAVGDSLKILITLARTESLEIVGVVCNRRVVDDQSFRYGLYFEYDAAPDDPHSEAVLAHLEEEVKRAHFQPV